MYIYVCVYISMYILFNLYILLCNCEILAFNSEL